MSRAFVFPGQGAQTIGMGKALAEAYPAARAVFDEVDEALGESLSSLIWEGEQDALTLTQNAQPALMASSLAVMAALQAHAGIGVTRAAFVAGHSLGEYSALAAAGAFSVADAAVLLRIRGRAMQEAVPVGQGAMAALLGATLEQAEAACDAARGVVTIANDNAPGQIVISGEEAAVDAAIGAIKEMGVRKAMKLAVSAPFHCPLMQPAADRMAQALGERAPTAPATALVANVTAVPTEDAATISRQLVAQVTGRVRWRETIEWLVAEGGVRTIVEVGTGRVLTTMLKRHMPEIEGIAINTPADVEMFAARLAVAQG